METQNNLITDKTKGKELSIGVKILLLIGGFFAAISANAFLVATVSLRGTTMLIFGLIFGIGSILLSHIDKAEVKFALVAPFYISGICLIGLYFADSLRMDSENLAVAISFLSIPALLLSGEKMLRHLAIAQALWATPFWFSSGPKSPIYLLLAYMAIAFYLVTVIKENQIRRRAVLAEELRALRIVLLILAIALMLWLDFSYWGTEYNSGIRSIIMALILLPMTFWAADRAGLTMSILFLIYSLTLFYYNCEMNLLHKSLFLMISGLVLLGLSYGVKRFFQ